MGVRALRHKAFSKKFKVYSSDAQSEVATPGLQALFRVWGKMRSDSALEKHLADVQDRKGPEVAPSSLGASGSEGVAVAEPPPETVASVVAAAAGVPIGAADGAVAGSAAAAQVDDLAHEGGSAAVAPIDAPSEKEALAASAEPLVAAAPEFAAGDVVLTIAKKKPED